MRHSSSALLLDRRQLSDRRLQPTSLGSALRLHGRRRGFRRVGEGRNTYVDCLAPRISGLAVFILLSSILDAYLTILHLQRGGGEANPLMALVLTYGYTPFLAIKIVTTGVGTWLLAVHQQFILAWKALHALAGIYALLLIYHLLLMLRHTF
jgi:Domain of unknown function (DUF5658)